LSISLPAKDNSIDHHIDPATGGPVTGPAARTAPRHQPEGDPASFVVMGWGGPGGITPYGLARRSLGSQVLWLFGVSASAPMTVLAGGTVATFAATGVIAVPLSFPLLAVALGLFAIGYTRLARDVPHAATFAALLTPASAARWARRPRSWRCCPTTACRSVSTGCSGRRSRGSWAARGGGGRSPRGRWWR